MDSFGSLPTTGTGRRLLDATVLYKVVVHEEECVVQRLRLFEVAKWGIKEDEMKMFKQMGKRNEGDRSNDAMRGKGERLMGMVRIGPCLYRHVMMGWLGNSFVWMHRVSNSMYV